MIEALSKDATNKTACYAGRCTGDVVITVVGGVEFVYGLITTISGWGESAALATGIGIAAEPVTIALTAEGVVTVVDGVNTIHYGITAFKKDADQGKEAKEADSKAAESGSKADVLAQNRVNGRAFEQQEFAKFSSQNSKAVEQITVKTPSGVRTRVDAIGLDTNGNVVINEYKSSLTAPLTDNQKIAFPEISESGATVVGKGKGIFTGGYQIPPGTKVTIIRPE